MPEETGTQTEASPAEDDKVNPGFVHMGAALMAMEHFNQRNASVVPELAELGDCTFQFDITGSRMIDSGSTHLASRSLVQAGQPPCAMAGPYHDLPAIDLSVMAQAAQVPIVIQRSFNIRSTLEFFSPFSSQVYPDNEVVAEKLIDFLRTKGRTDYISIFFPFTDGGLQWKDILTAFFQANGIESYSQVIFDPTPKKVQHQQPLSVTDNLALLQKRGFRTIVVSLENPRETIPKIADAAEALGMNTGDYFWVWLGDFSEAHLYSDNRNITKLIHGSAWLLAIESMYLKGAADPFGAALINQGPDFVQRLNAANPIRPGDPGYYFAQPDFFAKISNSLLDHHGAGFMYDAMMSIGMGACSIGNPQVNASGFNLLQGIRGSEFTGASGKIRFKQQGPLPGGRDGSTALFGVLNLLPGSTNEGSYGSSRFSDVFQPELGAWTQMTNFTFGDGRMVPPDLMRDPPQQNYLPKWLQVIGITLLAIVLASALATSVWVFLKRVHPVLRAAQPSFLYALCFGSAVFGSAILPLSFDESYGWSEQQLSAGCVAVPWLVGFGHIITYSALFAKLWRVNKVLQFKKRKIEIRHVMWPAAILAVAAFVDLGLWTGLDPPEWVRVELDPTTGESIGFCDSTYLMAFAAPLAILMLIPTVLTGFMAWKTKDVDEAYTESWWIFALILVQVELAVIGAPVVAILRTVSTTGKYIGFVAILWAFPMSTLSLIMLPKVVAYVRAVRGIAKAHKRGSRETVRVSGLNLNPGVKRPSQLSSMISDESYVMMRSEAEPETTAFSAPPESAVCTKLVVPRSIMSASTDEVPSYSVFSTTKDSTTSEIAVLADKVGTQTEGTPLADTDETPRADMEETTMADTEETTMADTEETTMAETEGTP